MKGISKESTLSLFRYFHPGDRVKRRYKQAKEGKKQYEGIIIAMDHNSLEIYWDTVDGIYCPNLIDMDFTMCGFNEVMKGNNKFSPVKHKKINLFD